MENENFPTEIVLLAIQTNNAETLMVRTRKFPEYWQHAGGGVQNSDTGIVDALIREVEEEIGVIFTPNQLSYLTQVRHDYHNETVIHCYTTKVQKIFPLKVDNEEILEHKWFTHEETQHLAMLPATQQIVEFLHTEPFTFVKDLNAGL